ncbi:hypothetical protein PG993_005500 [Apiospora rasikravindrae]|uniref:Ankyrin n=1 Tax=Apiospora rasikravindrae TaxID=990691 RepID=A0ABR1TFR3_9PEZI
MQNIISSDRGKGIDPQAASALARLPQEIHLAIAMASDSDESIFALLGTCKLLFNAYRDLLYERNIRHDDGSAVFKIARSGEVAAFEHLERVAKTMKEGFPDLDRVQFRSFDGRTLIAGSLYYSTSLHFTLDNSFTPLHWAAAGGHSGAVQWLITKGADCKALGKSTDDTFVPQLNVRQKGILAVPEPRHAPCTPLWIAVCAGHLETSRHLLAADPGAFDYKRRTSDPKILDAAVIYGHVNIIRFLVHNGYACPTDTTLKYAVHSASPRASLRCLAELGEDIFVALDQIIINPFDDIGALSFMRDPTMRVDLGRRDNKDPSTNQGTSLLVASLTRGWAFAQKSDELRDLVVFLIQSGADVNCQSHRWLRKSTSKGEKSLVSSYLEELRESSGQIEDFATIRDNGSCAAVYKLELLLKHGAVLDKDCGFHPLEDAYHIATSKVWSCNAAGELSFIKALVDNGVTREPAGGEYRTRSYLYKKHKGSAYGMHYSFLFRALTSGHYDIARIFIERGGTCFGVHDRMEDIDQHYARMPEDIREWIDAAYFL